MVVMSGMKSCRSFSSAVYQGWILGPIEFNIFINYMDNWAECNLSNFTYDTKLEGVVDATEVSDSGRKDLSRPENQANRNLIEFKTRNTDFCHRRAEAVGTSTC